MNFRVFESTEDLVHAAAAAVLRVAKSHERPVIALSGGSTPPPLYRLLSFSVTGDLGEKSVVWVVGDERDVPHGSSESNRTMIEQTLFGSGMPSSHSFLFFDTSKEDRDDVAREFERRWHELGISRLSLAILGIGDDGHTASLFPGTEGLAISDRIAIANHVPQLGTWRYTLTMPVLQSSEETMVLAVGEKKREMLLRIEQGEDFPAARALEGEGTRWWFVDRAARPRSSIERQRDDDGGKK